VRTSEKGGVQKQRAENPVGPVSDDVAARASFLRLEPNTRSGKTDRYFICRGGPAVPRAAACGARRQCCGAREGAPSLEKRYPLTSLLLIPSGKPLARAMFGVFRNRN